MNYNLSDLSGQHVCCCETRWKEIGVQSQFWKQPQERASRGSARLFG